MLQEQEQRHVYSDRDLKIEAYQLSGIVQKFPNHFHDYYVIGFVEGGRRRLSSKNQEYDLSAGDLVLFHPRDNHFCAPMNGELLDYRAVNIEPARMKEAVREISGRDFVMHFTQNVIYQSDITQSLDALFRAIVSQAPKLEKEEAFYFLMEQLQQEYAEPFENLVSEKPDGQIKKLCAYLEEHFAENITLDELLSMTNCGKSYLMCSFTKQTGVSPYRYLQTVRLERVKKFLEQGIAPIDAAAMAGFTDQSHFTRFFKEFIGLTPKQYQRIFTGSRTSEKPETGTEEESKFCMENGGREVLPGSCYRHTGSQPDQL